MKDLVGKTAFITGAASGIGLGVATRLAQAGVKVMMCDIERAALEKAVAELKRRGRPRLRFLLQGAMADVAAIVHSLEANLRNRLVCALKRLFQRCGSGGHAQHAPSGGDRLAVLQRRSGVKALSRPEIGKPVL